MDKTDRRSMRQRRQTPRRRQTLRAYLGCIPTILAYQAVAAAVSAALLWGVRKAGMALVYLTGRVAVTSGDFAFLFTTWEGWLVIALALVSLTLLVSLDVNGVLYLAGRLLAGEEARVRDAVPAALRLMGRFLNPRGLLVVLYIAVAAPLVGVGFTIGQTAGLYVPAFITSVIWSTPLYAVAYVIALTVLGILGIRYLFVLPAVVVEGRSVGEAFAVAPQVMRGHWRHFLPRMLVFAVQAGLVFFVVGAAVLAAPAVLGVIDDRFWMLLVLYAGSAVLGALALTVQPLQSVEIARLYLGYVRGDEGGTAGELVFAAPRVPWLTARRVGIVVVAVVAVLAAAAGASAALFDLMFPAGGDAHIVAHRLGGNAAAENSLAGLETSIDLGAYGYETDVQRAADGVYVINHDNGFARTCGVDAAVSELTSDRIAQLRIAGPDGSGEPVPTLDETLDAARGHGVLFIELKGPTADRQMADDVVAAVRKRGMEDQVAIIGLDYGLVSYVERTYPELTTGYLYFFSFGDAPALDCDLLVLEEEAATPRAIEAIHTAGKQAYVWTVDTEESAESVLAGDADGVITDEVAMCQRVERRLRGRSDYERVVDALTLD